MGDCILLFVLGHEEIWILIINQLCTNAIEKELPVSSRHFEEDSFGGSNQLIFFGCIIKLNSIKWKFRRHQGRTSTIVLQSTPEHPSGRLTGVLSATTSSKTTLTIIRIIFSLEWGIRNAKKVLRKVLIPLLSTAKVKLHIFGNPIRKVLNIILKLLLKHTKVML